MKRSLHLLKFFFCIGFTSLGWSQENITYQQPSSEILALADYERAPSATIDSKNTFMILSYRNTYKTLDDLNQEELRLGGLRINPKTNISSTVTYINNLKIKRIAGAEIQVKGLPDQPKITYVGMSPDEKKIAFTNTVSNGVELWVIDVLTAQAKQLTDASLNATMGSPYTWLNDSESLLIRTIPANKPSLINSSVDLPTGPIVSVGDGKVSQNRTYQDLLKNPTDELNFDIIVTSELHKININGNKTPFLKADLYTQQSVSPDGNYVMITTLEKPYSYIVPLSRFPQRSTVYSTKDAKKVAEVNSTPLTEIMPKGFSSTREGKRSMHWASDRSATLSYVEALDKGDQANVVEYRDELFMWNAPFDEAPQSIFKTNQRFAGILYGNEKNMIVYDSWYDTRIQNTYLVDPSKKTGKKIHSYNYQDIYADPGNFETVVNQFGRSVMLIQDNKAYLIGEGNSPEGQFPFIDEVDLNNFSKKRLYTSRLKNQKEDIFNITDLKKGNVLVSIQSKTEYPNYYFRNIKTKKTTKITDFKNPFESIKDVQKQVINYTRKDGLPLSGTLYLPAGYDKKEKLPLLIWAYPQEFADKNSAGQSDKNANEFTFPYYGSFVYWSAKGYAVLDDAAFPIVGENGKEPNDSFIEQLVANAEAAIDAVDKLGYINRNKVAVGGHSYGAFMTANLLTHSNLFACGIARSGAYNRTLTPFGFQREQRNYWDVPEVYNNMSPFMNADKMKTPMLLVHGEADNNPGTFTLQTERYFQALKNLGAPVRMVILPKESHSYVAKENIFHLLWEQDQFLEKHLKN